MKIKISQLENVCVEDAVKIHLDAFPEFFLSFLGANFLKILYSFFISSDKGIALCAYNENDDCVGVIAGTTSPNGFFKKLLKKKWLSFCFASIPAIIRNPMIVPRIFRAVFYRGGEMFDNQGYALLSTIAISKDSQGEGIGQQLILEWLSEVREKGSLGAYLTTDADENERVNDFYKSSGWKFNSSFLTKEKRNMNLYVYSFDGKTNE